MYTFKTYKGNYYETVEAGHERTLFIGFKMFQVMSDVWEEGSYAVYWNGSEVRTQDWIETGVADASDEVIAYAKEWTRTKIYLNKLRELKVIALNEAAKLSRNDKARVYKGRLKGQEGKVVGFVESQWRPKVGIAISDVMVVKIEKDGRKFQNHKDVIWVAVENVEKIDIPAIDDKALDKAAADYAATFNWLSHFINDR